MRQLPAARLLLAVLLLMCIALPAVGEGAPGKAGPDAFAEAYLRTLRALAPDLACTLLEDGRSIAISIADGEDAVLSTENAYAEYLRSGEDMQAILDHYAAASLGVLQAERSSLTQAALFPTVKPLAYLDTLTERGITPVYDPLIEGLVILYVLDTPTAVRPIDAGGLDGLGLARDALRDAAMASLTAYLPQGEVAFVQSIGVLAVDGMYEPSLLLADLPALYDFDVQGDLVLAVPDRGPLFFVGSEDAEGMALLTGFAQAAYAEASYPVTDRLIRWTDAGPAWYAAE